MTSHITSPRNPRVGAAARLSRRREREATGHALLEGPHLLEAAVAAGVTVLEVFAREGDRLGRQAALAAGAALHVVSAPVIERIAATEHPRGPVAVIAIPAWGRLRRHETLVLWDIADPGNAGTLLRSAAAFVCDLAVTEHTVDLWDPKVLRAAAGAHFGRTLIRLGPDPRRELSDAGLRVVAATVAGGDPPPWVLGGEDPIALLLGSEPHGLPPEVVAESGGAVTIAMPGGTESLNVAAAGAILLHERHRLRGRS